MTDSTPPPTFSTWRWARGEVRFLKKRKRIAAPVRTVVGRMVRRRAGQEPAANHFRRLVEELFSLVLLLRRQLAVVPDQHLDLKHVHVARRRLRLAEERHPSVPDVGEPVFPSSGHVRLT